MKKSKNYIITLIFSLVVFQLSGQDAQKAYQNANILYKDGQYERAIEYYNKAITLDSSLNYAYLNRAKTNMQLQKWEAAIIDLDKVLLREVSNKEALLARGQSRHRLQLFEGAILDYDLLLELEERNIAASYHKGKALTSVKRYDEALIFFEKVVELQNADLENENSDYFKDIYLHIGNCYRLLKQHDQALQHYNLALKIDTDNPEIYFNRASAKYGQGNWEAAAIDYSKTLQLNENHISALYYRAMSYQFSHNYKEAINDFNVVLKKDPELKLAYVSRGFTYASMEKYKEALKDYNWVLEKDPKDAATYIRRGYVYMESAEYENAISDFSNALKEDDYYKPYALNNRGNCKRLQKDFEAALEDINQSLAIDSTNAWAYLNRALVYADQKKPKTAFAEMTLAIQYNEELPDIYFHRANLYFQEKNYDQALSDYSKLETLAPYYKTKTVAKRKKAAKRAFLKGQ